MGKEYKSFSPFCSPFTSSQIYCIACKPGFTFNSNAKVGQQRQGGYAQLMLLGWLPQYGCCSPATAAGAFNRTATYLPTGLPPASHVQCQATAWNNLTGCRALSKNAGCGNCTAGGLRNRRYALQPRMSLGGRALPTSQFRPMPSAPYATILAPRSRRWRLHAVRNRNQHRGATQRHLHQRCGAGQHGAHLSASRQRCAARERMFASLAAACLGVMTACRSLLRPRLTCACLPAVLPRSA